MTDAASEPTTSEPTASEPTASEPTASEPTSGGHPGRLRRIFVVVLLVLGFVLAPLSLIAVWSRYTVLDTDAYVSTVAPLARNQDVIDAAAARVTDRVVQGTDLEQRLQDALPPRAEAAAPAMTQAIEGVVHNAALKIFGSEQFATIWEAANRRAHTQVVAALTGKTTHGLTVKNGEVILDLTGVADKVRAKVKSLGFDLSKRAGQEINPKLVLFHAPNAGLLQDSIDALQTLAWLLPVLTLLCFAGAIALSRRRRRTLLQVGLGVAVGMVVILTALNLGRVPYLGLFPRPEGKLAGGAAYDQVLHGLRLEARALFVLGIVVAFGAWLAGPSHTAERIRGFFTNRERSGEPGAVAAWVGSAKVGLRVIVIAIGAIALVAIDHPSGWMVLTIAVLVLIALAVIEFVGRSASRSDAVDTS